MTKQPDHILEAMNRWKATKSAPLIGDPLPEDPDVVREDKVLAEKIAPPVPASLDVLSQHRQWFSLAPVYYFLQMNQDFAREFTFNTAQPDDPVKYKIPYPIFPELTGFENVIEGIPSYQWGTFKQYIRSLVLNVSGYFFLVTGFEFNLVAENKIPFSITVCTPVGFSSYKAPYLDGFCIKFTDKATTTVYKDHIRKTMAEAQKLLK